MNAGAIEFPAIGLSSPAIGRYYAFVAGSEEEMRECPLHCYVRGFLREQFFVDREGRRFNVENVHIERIDWVRVREIGVGASLVSAIFSGLNVPMMLSFDLTYVGPVPLEEIRSLLIRAVTVYPRYFSSKRTTAQVMERLRRAKGFKGLADAIAT